MSRFVKTIIAEAKSGQDTLKFYCRPMSRADALLLWSDSTLEDSDPMRVLTIFDRYVEKVEGAVSEDGVALTKEVVMDMAFFTSAVVEAALDWARQSLPGSKGKESQGNSEPSAR